MSSTTITELKQEENSQRKKKSFFPELSPIGCENVEASNPFKFPPGIEWVELCHGYIAIFRAVCLEKQSILNSQEEEKLKKRKRKEEERRLEIHEKHTYRSRISGVTLPSLRTFIKEVDHEIDEDLQTPKLVSRNLIKQSLPLRIRPVYKETNHELKTRKKEMFLVKYALQLKQEETEEYKVKEARNEKEIEKLSEELRKDAEVFDNFLKSSDEAAAKAMKAAELQTRLTVDKTSEVRRLQGNLTIIRADLTRKDELLKEYLNYKSFLLLFHRNYHKESSEDLTTEEWSKMRKLANKKKTSAPKLPDKKAGTLPRQVARRRSLLQPARKSDTSVSTSSVRSTTTKKKVVKANSSQMFRLDMLPSRVGYPEEWDEDQLKSKLASETIQYLVDDPIIIVREIHAKEDESVKLLYRMQDHQDNLEEQKHIHKEKVHKKDKELKRLVHLVNILQMNIRDITKRSEELQLKCKLLGGEEKGNVDLIASNLTNKVEKVYRCVFSRMFVRLDGLAMLACIETRLDQLLEEVESLPESSVKMLQKFKDKERRLAMREDKVFQQKIKQEDRLRKAIQRSNKLNLKSVGRKLVYRSAPPISNLTSKINHETKAESESLIFFGVEVNEDNY